MKRLLITLFAAAILPAFAQSTNPAVKVDPKNNKVSRPVVDKPKAPLMTRDQLRACFLRQDADRVEAEAIKLAQAAQAEDRKDLLNLKNELAEVRVEKNTIQDKLAAEERELAWHTRHKDAQNELVSVKKDTERYGFVCFSNLSESIFCLFPWDPMPVSMDPMETGKNIH